MSLTSDNNSPVAGSPFYRRAFLTLLGSVGIGVSAGARVFSTPLIGQKGVRNHKAKAAAEPPPRIDRNFMAFALDLGMVAAGGVSAWFKKFPKSKMLAELDRVSAPDRYAHADDLTMVTGYGVTFFPLPGKEHGRPGVAFFDLNTEGLIHVLPWYTVLALPLVDEIIVKDDKVSAASRAAYLLPRYPRPTTYNSAALPDRYRTAAGSTEFVYKGSDTDGEVTYRIFKSLPDQTLEELLKTGTLDVSFEP